MKFVPCHTMADVRANIDRVDRLLVKLLAERQCYIDEAAHLKQDRNTVRDPARVEEVVAKVIEAANEEGLDPKTAEQLWRALIASSIDREFDAWDRRHAG